MGYGKYPFRLLKPEEERELAARIKDGDDEARNTLITANLRLVVHLAKHYHCSGASLDDLIQEGTRRVASERSNFDPQLHNTRFSSYATYWIRNAIQRAIAANASLIRLPDYMFRLASQFRRAMIRLKADPTATELPGIKLSKRQYRCLLHALVQWSPYAIFGAAGEETSLEEGIADHYQPNLEIERAETNEQLYKALPPYPHGSLDHPPAVRRRGPIGVSGSGAGDRSQSNRNRRASSA